MDTQRFKQRVTVGVLLAGLGLVAFDLLTGAEWVAAALRLIGA
jgi:hypothetical protein